MRTEQEIVDRIKELENGSEDLFGFIKTDLVAFLSFDQAKQFMENSETEQETIRETWTEFSRDRDSVLTAINTYMNFAWSKANDCRGLSAMRSIMHFQAWLWLLEEEEAADALKDYSFYGKPELRAICEHYGWDWASLDDGIWKQSEGEEGNPPLPAADLLWRTQ